MDGNITTIYFHDEHKYKFIIIDNTLEVHFDDSIYHFALNSTTKGIIKNSEFSIETKILTKKLDIKDNGLCLEYTLDFATFKTDHTIIVELY